MSSSARQAALAIRSQLARFPPITVALELPAGDYAQRHAAALFGIIFGSVGVIYGLRTKEFHRAPFSPGRSEAIQPRWYHRVWVCSVSLAIVLISVWHLVHDGLR